MALTITPVSVNPAGSGGVRGNAASLKMSYTTITVGASGDYAAGGIPLTPQQLGMDSGVVFGHVATRTSAAANTVTGAVLDCTNQAAPKLKLNAIAAEAVGAGVVAAVYDVWAFGY